MKLKRTLAMILTASTLLLPIVSVAEDAPAKSNISITTDDSTLTLYKDSGLTDAYSAEDYIPAGTKVYYKITCDEGYFCYEFKVNAAEVTEEYFVVYEPTVECTVYDAMLGDTSSGTSDTLDLRDVSNLMRYIAGHKGVSTPAYWSGGGLRKYDFNRDGSVNLMDVTAELRAIAKHDGAYPVVERETDFGITHLAPDIMIESFAVERIIPWQYDSAEEPPIEGYAEDLLMNEYAYKHFINGNIGIFDTTVIYDAENGGYVPYAPRFDSYGEEFFENCTLDVKTAACNYGKIVSVDRIWQDADGQLTVMLSHKKVGDVDNTKYLEWMFLLRLPEDYDHGNVRLMYLNSDGRYEPLHVIVG